VYKDTSSFDDGADAPQVVFRAIVENAREQSAKLSFLVLGHRLSTIQAVVAASDTLSRQMVKFCKNIPAQSQVLVHGLVKKPKDYVKSTSIGYLEIHVVKLFVIAQAESPLPIQVEDCERPLPDDSVSDVQKGDTEEAQKEDARPIVSLNTRLNNRTIDLRAKLNYAIFSIKDGVVTLFQEFLRERHFLGVQTPKLLGAPSEGGASVFKVSYFQTQAYLAQSPQLYKQMLIASQFERVFEVGAIFRAENSNTARHLTEFTGLDLEMAFEEHYHEVVGLLEELMLYIFNGLRTRYARETELVRKTYHVEEFKLPEAGKVPRLEFKEGVKMLREAGVEIGDYDDLRYAFSTKSHTPKLTLATLSAPLRKNTSAAWCSRSTTPTSTSSTNTRSPSDPSTPCPPPRRPASPSSSPTATRTTSTCAGRRSCPARSACTITTYSSSAWARSTRPSTPTRPA